MSEVKPVCPSYGRTTTGQQQLPLLNDSPVALARLVNCPHCWQPPGPPCTVSGPAGSHFARYQRAERRGFITSDQLAAVVATLTVIAPRILVMDVTPEPVRLDGCTCAPICGSHAHSCAWSAR
jgi:hypothetical protein